MQLDQFPFSAGLLFSPRQALPLLHQFSTKPLSPPLSSKFFECSPLPSSLSDLPPFFCVPTFFFKHRVINSVSLFHPPLCPLSFAPDTLAHTHSHTWTGRFMKRNTQLKLLLKRKDNPNSVKKKPCPTKFRTRENITITMFSALNHYKTLS